MTELRQRMDNAMVLRGLALRTRDTCLACIRGLAKHQPATQGLHQRGGGP